MISTLKNASAEENLRKMLAASIAIAAAVMSGCASGNATDTPPSAPPATPTSTTPAYPERTAPAKSFDVTEPCSIISSEQAAGLGVDEEPRARDSRGVPGCNYRKGDLGGFNVFVSADKTKTMHDFAKTKSAAKPTEVAGYPAVSVVNKGIGEVLVVDISDHGSLMINAYWDDGASDSAELTTKFAEAALKNLPNA